MKYVVSSLLTQLGLARGMVIKCCALISRELILVGLTMCTYCPLTNCGCERIPEDCILNDHNLQYTCYVTGAHGNDVFRQLRLMNQTIGANVDHIKVEATPLAMNGVELSYSNRQILLHVSTG